MGSRILFLLRGASLSSSFQKPQDLLSNTHCRFRHVRRCSTKSGSGSSLQPPDVPRLAETARISLTESEVEEFAPKIRQVVEWFGQLQDVDLESIEPSLRAETEDDNLRDDSPEVFKNREALLAGVPVFEEAYVKVPKVLNKE